MRKLKDLLENVREWPAECENREIFSCEFTVSYTVVYSY